MAATPVDSFVAPAFSCPPAASFSARRFLIDLNLKKPKRDKPPTTIESSMTSSAIVPGVKWHRFDVDTTAVDGVELVVADAVVEVAKVDVISFELDVAAAAGSSSAFKYWYSTACRLVRPSVGIATTLVAARATVVQSKCSCRRLERILRRKGDARGKN